MCREDSVPFGLLNLVLLVKSCSVMDDAVPALGPAWVNSCICYVSVVRWSDHRSLYNGAQMVTVAWQGMDSYMQEMTHG